MHDEAKKHGLASSGKRVMMCPYTGKMLQAKVFFGPVYYQRLKHLVAEKIHARASGPLVTKTRQPTDGRARDGGQRFGEMERDAGISHGATAFLTERLMYSSDRYCVDVCRRCGFLASRGSQSTEGFWCATCKRFDTGATVTIPFGWKLLTQELAAVSIGMSLKMDVETLVEG